MRLVKSWGRTDGASRQGISDEIDLSALIVLGLSLAAAPSFAADGRNISIVNETGYAIKFLDFNEPDDLDEWDVQVQRAQAALRFRDQDDIVHCGIIVRPRDTGKAGRDLTHAACNAGMVAYKIVLQEPGR